MSTNITKQKRDELVSKINSIREFLTQSSDENATRLLGFLGELENDVTNKHYGLIFEEHRESIDEKLESSLPVLMEEKSLEIDNGGLQNFLIEGDNLASLKLLEKTHRGKIDVIYIDPPYNTGNKDFIYDDFFIDSTDTFRHSKWCSFMKKRLEIARKLLSEKGVIFISIDDNEQAALKLLCDGIFGEGNFVACLPTIMNLKGNQDEFAFAGTHEYTIVYVKNKEIAQFYQFPIDDDEETFEWSEDEIGFYKRGANLKSTGVNAPREKRPNLFFPIYISETNELNLERKSKTDIELFPITDEKEMSWRWSKKKILSEKGDIIIVRNNNDVSLYKKQRPELNDLPSKKPKSIFYKPEYSSGNGTAQIKAIFNNKVFSNPKPVDLIYDFIQISTVNSQFSTILDFFAGSGTTGHAVMKLNATDNGNRKFILCTNNQNNICRDITYERLKRVIEKENYSASLKYFRVDFVDITDKLYYEYADELLEHTRELVELENAINFNKNSKIAICLTEEELDSFCNSKKKINAVEKIYLGHEVQTTAEQEDLFNSKQIEIIRIPNYYYSDVE